MFSCDCCGLCCRNLSLSPLYADLDRGDGICRYLDCETNLCSIYEHRPDKCNIDRSYEQYFKEYMTREAYYRQNYEACETLNNKKEER